MTALFLFFVSLIALSWFTNQANFRANLLAPMPTEPRQQLIDDLKQAMADQQALTEQIKNLRARVAELKA